MLTRRDPLAHRPTGTTRTGESQLTRGTVMMIVLRQCDIIEPAGFQGHEHSAVRQASCTRF